MAPPTQPVGRSNHGAHPRAVSLQELARTLPTTSAVIISHEGRPDQRIEAEITYTVTTDRPPRLQVTITAPRPQALDSRELGEIRSGLEQRVRTMVRGQFNANHIDLARLGTPFVTWR